MRAIRAWLSQPAGTHPWLLAALVGTVGIGCVVAAGSTLLDDDGEPGQRPAPTATAPPAVIGAIRPTQPATVTPDPGGAARPAARAFLSGYLAFLYGRGDASDVRPVTAAVRRELAANRPRIPPAQRQRRPRVIDLRVTRQAADAVLATATIDDGDVAVYPIVFSLDRDDAGTWRVSRLAND